LSSGWYFFQFSRLTVLAMLLPDAFAKCDGDAAQFRQPEWITGSSFARTRKSLAIPAEGQQFRLPKSDNTGERTSFLLNFAP
jgi:hypothetical protein